MKTTFLVQISSLLSMLDQMVTALPSGVEFEARSLIVNGRAVFKSTIFNSTTEENYWAEDACSLDITGLAGYTGIIGPWSGSCREVQDYQETFVMSGTNNTEIAIDPNTATIIFTNAQGERYQCLATGLDDGEGCDSWEKISSTAPLAKVNDWMPHHNPAIEMQPPQCLYGAGTIKNKGGIGEQPVKWLLYKQISQNVQCPTAQQSCSVTSSLSHSYDVSFTASVTPLTWITGGFSVSESTTTGSGTGCGIRGSKGPGAATTCMYKVVPHTAYNARNVQQLVCPPGAVGQTPYKHISDVFRIRSPNVHQNRAYHRCSYGGRCHYQGYHFWAKA